MYRESEMKRIIIVMLIIFLVLLFAGCPGGKTPTYRVYYDKKVIKLRP